MERKEVTLTLLQWAAAYQTVAGHRMGPAQTPQQEDEKNKMVAFYRWLKRNLESRKGNRDMPVTLALTLAQRRRLDEIMAASTWTPMQQDEIVTPVRMALGFWVPPDLDEYDEGEE